MTALTSLYPDEAARAVRAEAALPGTYAEVAARSGLTEEQALAALHVLRGAGRVVRSGAVFSRATPEQLLLAGSLKADGLASADAAAACDRQRQQVDEMRKADGSKRMSARDLMRICGVSPSMRAAARDLLDQMGARSE